MTTERQDRDDLINAWLDGDLDESGLRALARDPAAGDWQGAQLLQALLHDAAEEQAPPQLQGRLLAIPTEESKPPAWSRLRRAWGSWFTLPSPAWRMALAAVPAVAVALWLLPAGDEPGRAEIERGQRDLAIALTYLQKTHSRAGQAIGRSVDRRLSRPVLGVVEETVQSQLDLSEET